MNSRNMPGQRCSQAGTRDATSTSGTDSGEGVLGSPRMSPRRCTLAALALLPACVPEPANAVEIRTAVAELVDQTRAMAIEHALVDLTTNLDPSLAPDGGQLIVASIYGPVRADPADPPARWRERAMAALRQIIPHLDDELVFAEFTPISAVARCTSSACRVHSGSARPTPPGKLS
mgnify:CR=1 FL=1